MSRAEKELSSDEMYDSAQSNLSGEEWNALRYLADDRNFLIQGAVKGSSVVV